MKLADICTRTYEGGNLAVEICNADVGMSVYFGANPDDAARALELQIDKAGSEEYNLKNYDEWKKWLMADQEKHGNHDYYDNWLFADCHDIKCEPLLTINAWGEIWYIAKTLRHHDICGKEFWMYEARSKDGLVCYALLGFEL